MSVLVRTPTLYLEVFLGSASNRFALIGSTSCRTLRRRICLPASPTLVPGQLTPGRPSTLRLPIDQTIMGGTGILTRLPSTTPFGLALGSDLPWAELPSPGNLRFSAKELLTPFIATHPCIITSTRSSSRFRPPSTHVERSPTALHQLRYSTRGFGCLLQSRSFSAQRHSASKLLRTF